MKIAYLTNRYPEVSHSFIRREIAAVEAAGAAVERWSVRRPHGDLPDPRDQSELGKTHFILEAGILALLWCWCLTCRAEFPLRIARPAYGRSIAPILCAALCLSG
jgi:hypothetical protein